MSENTVLEDKNSAMAIGRVLEPGQWLVVGQSRIDQFAEVTEDHQFIHIDPERAQQTPLGGTIAHGFFTLSLLTKLVEGVMPASDNVMMGINYGFDKVRFLSPVKAGDAVRLQATVADVQEKETNKLVLKLDITVEIKGQDKPALVCEWLNMLVCE